MVEQHAPAAGVALATVLEAAGELLQAKDTEPSLLLVARLVL